MLNTAALAIHLLVFCAAGLAAERCSAEHYKVIALPLRPWAISNSSEVAGTTGNHTAAIWDQQHGLKQLPKPPGFAVSEAVNVNPAGRAVGFVAQPDGSRRRGFRYVDGKLTLLAGEPSRPYAINDHDQIAGESFIAKKAKASPVVWKRGIPTDLGACCGGAATSINNQGQVVGNLYDREGRYHAFLWKNSRIRTLGPEGDFSSAIAINDRGHVLVDGFSHGTLLYVDGKPARLDLSPKYPSKATAMNSCDVVVGSFGPYSDADRAFIWDNKHGFRDLNDLVPPNSGWKLEHATGINDRGEIVGWGDHDHTEDAGFLLLPTEN